MKKHGLTGIILLTVLLGACQATPDEDIVVQKGNSLSEATGKTDSVETYQYPTQWQEDLTYETAKINVPINAAIQMPEIKTIPIYHGNRDSTLPQAVVDKVIEEFFGGSKITDSDRQKTKAEIQQEISNYQKKVSDLKANDKDENSISIFENMIKDLEKLLPTAPDNSNKQPVNTDMSLKNSNGSYGFNGTGIAENGKPMNIIVASKDENFGNSITVVSATHGVYPIPNPEAISKKDGTITQEEAIAQATALVNRLGIQDMQLSSAEFSGLYEGVSGTAPSQYGYTITFSRTVNEIINHTQSFMSQTSSRRRIWTCNF